MPVSTTGASIFAGVGALLTLGALVGFVRQRSKFAKWTPTQGVIVSHRVRHSRRDGRTHTFYHPIARFHAGGREWLYESSLSTSEKRFEEGSSVALLYDPNNPESATIDTVGEKYFVAMLVGAIGSVFATVGGYLLGTH